MYVQISFFLRWTDVFITCKLLIKFKKVCYNLIVLENIVGGAMMEIKKVLVSQLKPAPYNPRFMPEHEKEALKKSIKEFGLVEPLVYNKQTGHVVGGNQRLIALKELGFTEVEVVEVDLPLKKEKALNLALNRINGQWDNEQLALILKELDENLQELTGFEKVEIEDLLNSLRPPEEVLKSHFGEDGIIFTNQRPSTSNRETSDVEAVEEEEIVITVYCPASKLEMFTKALHTYGFRYEL